jgi:hypothetical protein
MLQRMSRSSPLARSERDTHLIHPAMSEMGQNRISSLRGYVFCFAPESGHRALQSACLFRAKERNRSRGRALRRGARAHQQRMERQSISCYLEATDQGASASLTNVGQVCRAIYHQRHSARRRRCEPTFASRTIGFKEPNRCDRRCSGDRQ